MYKKLNLFIAIAMLLGANALAMEQNSSVLTPDQFPLQELLQGGSVEQKLKKLQTVANLLLFQAESYQSLKKIIPVMEVLHTLQPHRVIDQEGKQFLSAYRLSTDAIIERYTQYKERRKTINVLNVHVPEAQALALQIGHFLDDWKLKRASQVYKLDYYIDHANENIRAVAGVTKHYIYSYQLAHLVFGAPQALTRFNFEIRSNYMSDEWMKFLDVDVSAYQMVMRVGPIQEMIFSLANLIEYYRASGSDDDMFEIYIDGQCLNEMDRAKRLCVLFESSLLKFQRLYDQVRTEMSRLILQAGKNDRPYQQALRNTYCIRNPQLFNTNQKCELKDYHDLAVYYVVAPELPIALDCKIMPLSIFAPPAMSEIKKSFLPASKSVPVTRKPQQGKKKNKSQPGSRPVSPNPSSESSQASSAELPKLVQPVVVAPVARPKQTLLNIKYDPRVLRWFNPESQDPEVLHATRECIEYHCFSWLVDQYLIKYGVRTPWQNRAKVQRAKETIYDTNYSLGGTIEYPNAAKRVVVFHCCKDQKDVCYHRGVQEKENNALFEEYFAQNHWNVFHRDEFPALGQSHTPPFAQLESNGDDEVIAEDDLCVKIRDNHMNMNIVLYKPAAN